MLLVRVRVNKWWNVNQSKNLMSDEAWHPQLETWYKHSTIQSELNRWNPLTRIHPKRSTHQKLLMRRHKLHFNNSLQKPLRNQCPAVIQAGWMAHHKKSCGHNELILHCCRLEGPCGILPAIRQTKKRTTSSNCVQPQGPFHPSACSGD